MNVKNTHRGAPEETATSTPCGEPSTSVLVCEDDEGTLDFLRENLSADRYTVLTASSGREAVWLLEHRECDLAVLDVVLPDMSGLDVCDRVRGADGLASRIDPETPVIMLSGRGSSQDRIRGLARGADDYVVKPFRYEELLARIEATLRRTRKRRRLGVLRVGELVVDPVTRRVSVGDRAVELSAKEFSLLRKLASDPTRVFTKRELLEDVWEYRAMGNTRTLDSHASRLRKKLNGCTGGYVNNVWGVGYRLVEAA